MGLKNRLKKSLFHKSNESKELPNRSISNSDVTEESLQAWLALPSKIRHDPSLASFQLEHERLHGHEAELQENDDNDQDIVSSSDRSDFINMNIIENKTEMIESENNNSGSSCSSTAAIPTVSESPIEGTSISNQQNSSDIKKPEQHDSSGSIDKYTWQRNVKIASLLFGWIVFTIFLAQRDEKDIQYKQFAIDEFSTRYFTIPEKSFSNLLALSVEGSFRQGSTVSSGQSFLSITVENLSAAPDNNNQTTIASTLMTPDIWKIPIVQSDLIDVAAPVIKRKVFDIDRTARKSDNDLMRLKFQTNSNVGFALKLGYDVWPVDMHIGVLCAISVLILLYVLIIFEIVHRTFAAIMASVASVSILAILHDRPTMADIVVWMDIETLLLLFSMMILVAILTDTGVFDYIAVYSFKITNGKIWPLIHCLCIATALVSSFLDNVTTILLMTPVSIRLCEVMHLNPIPVLMAIVVHANVGGTITPVGDPPNIMITTNPYIRSHGVTFLTFTFHMTIGVLFVLAQTALQLRIQYRDIHDLRANESKEIADTRREIMVWKRAAANLLSFPKKGDIVKNTLLAKVKFMEHKLKKLELSGTDSSEAYKCTLDELKQSYPIKNKQLLIKAGFVLAFVVALFFIQSIPQLQRLSLGWCALLGVLLLLIIADRDDMDTLMHRIEWTTLIFFAAMFVTMECLARMGLINWIGKQTETIILSVGEDARLAVAIIIILWVSALTSAFVESIPVTAMMIKVVISLAENETLSLPIQPLVWALAFGPCLGGNGTLYGASANVICAGIAEQHGYKMGFIEYMKVCFPIMIGSIVVINGYLMVAHILFEWH